MKSKRLIVPILTVILLASLTSTRYMSDPQSQEKKYHYFEDPLVCEGCHFDKFKTWSSSQHAKGFSGDFFQAQFYEVVLPSRSLDEKVANANEDCIGCHSPSAFLSGDMIPRRTPEPDNHWDPNPEARTRADRGIFCDFCHTLGGFENEQPFNHDFISHATADVDPKYADLEFPWSPHHETATSEIYESTDICATCHNELNPYGVWVKATEHEYSESVFAERGVLCQFCHMQPMGGKPAKMGYIRTQKNTTHWFGGGFAEFVEGAAAVYIQGEDLQLSAGEEVEFSIQVKTMATGHKFPTGSVEERDVWLHVSLNNERGEEILHIPVPPNPDDPNDRYFITSNAKVAYPSHSTLSDPIARDALTEGDRLYHSAFLDSEGEFTYAQWLCVEEIENRLEPLEERMEHYRFTVPELESGEYYLTAQLNYRRMPDSLADFFGIDRRPVMEVSKDVRAVALK